MDATGREVAIPARPKRVVSLAPNLTEIVFALGAGDRLVADTLYCNYPPEATTKTRVGDTQHPDLERIVALEADLVLISTASQLEATVGGLDRLGIPVYVTAERDLDSTLATIERLGDVLGVPERGRALAAELRSRIQAVRARVEGRGMPKVFVMVSDQPLMTTGKGTFLDDLVARAGGASISSDETTEWPQYSAETVVARAPDVILVPGVSPGVADGGMALPETLTGTPAALGGRVVRIEADLLMRPGPRLVDGLEKLAAALHPETFP